MSVYRPKDKSGAYKTKLYHYDFTVKLPTGERARFCGSTGQTSLRAAERIEQQYRELAAAGKMNTVATLNEAAWRYYEEVAQHQPSAVDTAKSLEHLVRLVGKDVPLIALTADRIADAARRRAAETVEFRNKSGVVTRTRPVQPATVNRQIVECARRLLRRAKRVWRMPVEIDLPWGDLKLPEPQGRVRIMKKGEQQSFWELLRPDYAAIFLSYQMTGARKAALCLLPKKNVDFERDGFTIMLKRKRGELPREHFIPFDDELRAIFKEEMAKSPCPYVFTYEVQRGRMKGMRKPITYNGLRRVFDNARAGIEDFRLHDIRHDTASRVVRETGNLYLAGKLLGHADISSTQRYAHVDDSDLRKAISSLSLNMKRKNSR